MLGCGVDVVTMDEAVARAELAISKRETCQHVAINAAKLVKYQHDDTLRTALDGCELATADGQAVVWAARILPGAHLPERVAGIDLMEALLNRSALQRLPGVSPRRSIGSPRPSLEEIQARFPGITIAGSHHGYFDPAEEDAVVARDRRERTGHPLRCAGDACEGSSSLGIEPGSASPS